MSGAKYVWKGCWHSSVDSSAPTILLPRVQVPSTPSTNCYIVFMLYLSCEKNENKQKEAGFGPFLKYVWTFTLVTSCYGQKTVGMYVGDLHAGRSILSCLCLCIVLIEELAGCLFGPYVRYEPTMLRLQSKSMTTEHRTHQCLNCNPAWCGKLKLHKTY